MFFYDYLSVGYYQYHYTYASKAANHSGQYFTSTNSMLITSKRNKRNRIQGCPKLQCDNYITFFFKIFVRDMTLSARTILIARWQDTTV